MKSPILIVDDEAQILQMISKYLQRLDIECLTASNGEQALEILDWNDDCQIVLCDLSMPYMDGLTFIRQARENINRHVEFVILTGNGEKNDVVEALRLGVCEFLDKPMCFDDLMEALDKASRAVEKHEEQKRQLEEAFVRDKDRLNEINALKGELQGSMEEQIDHLSRVAKYHDIETAEHCKRVGLYASKLAELMGMEKAFCTKIQLAAILHDIGKVGVSDAILKKPGKLTNEEYNQMKNHAEIGAEMLTGSKNEVINMAAEIALGHHEYFDGTGYPQGLRGNMIPLVARISCLADIYDALRSKRCYKEAFSHEKTVDIIVNGDGRTSPGHFDPEVLKAFKGNHHLFADIFEGLPDQEAYLQYEVA